MILHTLADQGAAKALATLGPPYKLLQNFSTVFGTEQSRIMSDNVAKCQTKSNNVLNNVIQYRTMNNVEQCRTILIFGKCRTMSKKVEQC